METLLQINTSIFSNGGQSSQLADRFVANWSHGHPDRKVFTRDLAKAPVPHLDGARFGAFISKPDERTAEQTEVLHFSDALIQELRDADVVVLGLPMYNFGIPSTLKAYFDHIARAGVTFRYTDKGPVGALTGKKVYVFAARGGYYAGTPIDTQSSYLRQFLGFLGMEDVEFTYAEGLNIGASAKEESLARARARADMLSLSQAIAA
jgi:FMN-dependent NADH-azoreductase